jgi:hypothetical protein
MEKMPDMILLVLAVYFGKPARFFSPCLGDRTLVLVARWAVRRALATSPRVDSTGVSSVMNLA